MNKNETKLDTTEQNPEVPSHLYKRPELKKHGKLKNTASQTVSTYTYTIVWG